jgi:hypothetical protein
LGAASGWHRRCSSVSLNGDVGTMVKYIGNKKIEGSIHAERESFIFRSTYRCEMETSSRDSLRKEPQTKIKCRFDCYKSSPMLYQRSSGSNLQHYVIHACFGFTGVSIISVSDSACFIRPIEMILSRFPRMELVNLNCVSPSG